MTHDEKLFFNQLGARIAQLRKQGGDDILVVAGGVIPAQDYDELRAAGVAAIFGPGTNISFSVNPLFRHYLDTPHQGAVSPFFEGGLSFGFLSPAFGINARL